MATGGGFATVRVEASTACARCAAGRGCGAGLLQRGRTRTVAARVPRDLHLEPGDVVELRLEPDHLLQAAWLAYGLPLLCSVLAVAAASAVTNADTEWVVILCGFAGLVAGLIVGRRILRTGGCLRDMTPVAARRVAAVPIAESSP